MGLGNVRKCFILFLVCLITGRDVQSGSFAIEINNVEREILFLETANGSELAFWSVSYDSKLYLPHHKFQLCLALRSH